VQAMPNRRDFIKAIIRYILLLTLILTSTFMLFKEDDGTECDFDFVCRACKKSKSCALPEAKKYRSKGIKG